MKCLNTYLLKCLKFFVWSLEIKHCLGFGAWGLGFLTRIIDHIGYLYLRYNVLEKE
ncbi:MAG: hypothetical protein ABIL74_10510 [candidate division WOR-3 bacterium]